MIMLKIGVLRRLYAELKRVRRRERSRRELIAMDERELRDIGASRGMAVHEADKPFWKA